MTKKNRKEIQEVFKKYIKYLETHLESRKNFLCLMPLDIDITEQTINMLGRLVITPKKCGWNDRMIPNAVLYLKSQRPTPTKNKVIYNKPFFHKNPNSDVWWVYDASSKGMNYDLNIAVNMEKIQFLQHLINKLK